jgi:hypothetical protein
MRDTTIHIRIESDLKSKLQEHLAEKKLNISEVLRSYIEEMLS